MTRLSEVTPAFKRLYMHTPNLDVDIPSEFLQDYKDVFEEFFDMFEQRGWMEVKPRFWMDNDEVTGEFILHWNFLKENGERVRGSTTTGVYPDEQDSKEYGDASSVQDESAEGQDKVHKKEEV